MVNPTQTTKPSDRRLLWILLILIVVGGGSLLLLEKIHSDREADTENKMALQAEMYRRLQDQMQAEKAASPRPLAPPEDQNPVESESLSGVNLEELEQEIAALYAAALEEPIEEQVFLDSLKALLAIGEPAYPEVITLITKLREDSSLMFTLGSRPRDLNQLIRSDELYAFYLYVLDSDMVSDSFRSESIRMLARTGGSDTIPRLTTLLETQHNDKVLQATVSTLGRLKAAEAVPALSRMLLEETLSESTRQAVLNALGQIQSPEALATLQQYTGPEIDEEIRSAALTALVRSGSEQAIPAALDVLVNGTPERKRNMLRSVAWRRTPVKDDGISSQIVLLATSDADPDVRRAAFAALRRFPPEVAIPTIIEGMTGQPVAVRHSGVRTIAFIDAPAALDAIRKIAKDDADESVREFAQRIVRRREAGDTTTRPRTRRRPIG